MSHVETEDPAPGVRVIAFNRPEVRNAFDTAMYAQVTDGLARRHRRRGRRCRRADRSWQRVHLGPGPGRDGRHRHRHGRRGRRAAASSGLLDCVVDISVPLLAAVNGVAVGSGLHHARPIATWSWSTPPPACAFRSPSSAYRPRRPAASSSPPPWAGNSAARSPARPPTGSRRPSWCELGLALGVSEPGAVLEETVALAARIASHPCPATRAAIVPHAGGEARRRPGGEPA